MPDLETPQDEVVVEIPDVPLREGEERFAAGLNLENLRRRESIIAGLQQQLRELGQDSAASHIIAKATGRSERERQRIIKAKVRELENSGLCPPATVINLNPVRLDLSGELLNYSVPAAGKGKLINLSFNGRTFVGSYVTFATPRVWTRPTGVSMDPSGDRPTMEAKHIPPLGIAHQFYLHYCSGASSGQRMGGILTFLGTIKELDDKSLLRNKNNLRVPRGEWDPDIPGEVNYVTYDRNLTDYLRNELQQQRMYAEMVIAQGHAYHSSQSEDERKQLSDRHRTWHDYALRMEYIKKPLGWAMETLQDSPLIEAVYCPYCHTQKDHPDQFFCKCGAPFNPYEAFMAGKIVAPEHLAIYEEDSKEWKDIMEKMEQQRRRLRLLNGEPEEPKKKH